MVQQTQMDFSLALELLTFIQVKKEKKNIRAGRMYSVPKEEFSISMDLGWIFLKK